jgi:anti-sigma B factor antagonist
MWQERLMQTTVGVFAARERAEEAVRRLLEHRVPEERILYLTRSETEAKSISRQFGIHASGLLEDATHMPASVSSTTQLVIPGVGPVFALGSGAAALFGLAGAGAAAAEASTAHGSAEDLAFFRRVLSEGHSVIIVRTDSSKIAATACEILDTLGLSMKKVPAPKGNVAWRQLHGAVIVDFSGKIAFAEGSGLLRDTVQTFLEQGHNRILLNLERVDYVDSVGLGELVRTEATVRGRGGQLKLVKPNANVHHLLRLTKLDRVFDIAPDEFTALQSFRAAADTKPSA